jgi:hypothetical protein
VAASGEPSALALLCAVDTWDYNGRGADPELGDATCSQAAEAGDPVGRVYNADYVSTLSLYDPRVDFEKSQMVAVAEYKKAADAGVAWGQYYYGKLLREGEGMDADPAAAETYLKAARDKGLPAADYQLGLLYLSEKVAGPDPDEAFAMMRKAADAGFDDAQFDLCQRLVGGYDWTEDLDAALGYCKAASNSATPYIAEKAKAFVPDVERRIVERDSAAQPPADPATPPN